MWEQLGVLEYQADAAAVLGHEHAGLGIDQDLLIEHDAAMVGTRETGDQIDGQRLAGAGTAEQGDDPDFVLECYLEIECGKLQPNIDADHSKLASRRLAARCTISEKIKAANAMAIDTMVSRKAP